MNDKLFPRRFMEALRPGAYLRILVEGAVGADDEVRVVERPDHGLTVRDVLRIYAFDRDEAGRLLSIPRMSEDWRWWAEHYLKEAKGGAAEMAGTRMPLGEFVGYAHLRAGDPRTAHPWTKW